MGKTLFDGSDLKAASVDLTSKVFGLLPVANGGTGANSLSAGVLIGNGTSAITSVAPGTTGNVLTSNGSAWVSQTQAGGGDMSLGAVQTNTQAKTFNSGTLKLAGATSGTSTLNAAAVAGTTTITLPGSTTTLVGTDTTDTLTNKTITSPKVNETLDTLGNREILFTATASSVNYLELVNGATGSSMKLRANGTDTDIALELSGKGAKGVLIADSLYFNNSALTSGATVNTDASLSNFFTLTLGTNVTLAAPTNPKAGQKVTWRLRQDGTGSRTLTLATGSAGQFRFGTDITSVTASTAINKTDYLGAIYNETDDRWDVVSFIKGF